MQTSTTFRWRSFSSPSVPSDVWLVLGMFSGFLMGLGVGVILQSWPANTPQCAVINGPAEVKTLEGIAP